MSTDRHRLSTLVVQRAIASIREVEEALARQVLYGGDLLTNLLEVCRLDEAALIAIAAESFGLHAAPAGPLPHPDPEAKRIVAAEVAAARNIAPLSVGPYGLVVAVAEPLATEVEQEISFALALPIVQHVALHVRIREALARDYAVPLERRVQRLLNAMSGASSNAVAIPSRRGAESRSDTPRPWSFMPAAVVGAPNLRSASPAAELRTLVVVDEPARATEAAPRRSGRALTLEEARDALFEAGDRERVFDAFFEFARQHFEYAAMFVVHGDVAEGRDAFGEGAPRDAVARLRVPLGMPSILASARQDKTVIQRVPAAQGVDAALVGDLERAPGTAFAVFPMVVRTRVVAMFVGDFGRAEANALTLADVGAMVAQASAAFERLIVRRKLQQTVPPGMESMAPGKPHVDAQPQPANSASEGLRMSTVTMPSNLGAAAEAAPRTASEGSAGATPSRRPSQRAAAPELVFRPEPLPPHSFGHDDTLERDLVVSVSGPPPPAEAPSQAKMPASEQQVSVGAHKPPSSRTDLSDDLPSVIVDVASEYTTLVERVVAGPGDPVAGAPPEDLEFELVRAGGYAMPAIMAQFPGPVTIDRSRLSDVPLPRVAECGPVLRLVASQRRTALPFVLSYIEDPDVEKRFWATFLLTELVYPDVLEPIVARVLDDVARVRRAARAAARAFAEASPFPIVERLGSFAANRGEDADRRVRAIDALGETCEPLAVPVLIPLLDDPEADVVDAAHYALTVIARQDFGTSSKKWSDWWEANRDLDRIEWLIEALVLGDVAVRAAAGEELKAIARESFGYDPELSKRDREKAQNRYRDWWNDVGRIRFSRATSSRG